MIGSTPTGIARDGARWHRRGRREHPRRAVPGQRRADDQVGTAAAVEGYGGGGVVGVARLRLARRLFRLDDEGGCARGGGGGSGGGVVRVDGPVSSSELRVQGCRGGGCGASAGGHGVDQVGCRGGGGAPCYLLLAQGAGWSADGAVEGARGGDARGGVDALVGAEVVVLLDEEVLAAVAVDLAGLDGGGRVQGLGPVPVARVAVRLV